MTAKHGLRAPHVCQPVSRANCRVRRSIPSWRCAMSDGRISDLGAGDAYTGTATADATTYLINGLVRWRRCERGSAANEPRERSEPAKRRARERERGSGGRSPPDRTRLAKRSRPKPLTAGRSLPKPAANPDPTGERLGRRDVNFHPARSTASGSIPSVEEKCVTMCT
jgi:hypothetical protein